MSEFMQIPPTYAVADPQVRAVLDALTRNVQITIDSIQATATVEQTPQVGGATTFGSPSSTTNITNFGGAYTVQNLKDDLVSGAVTAVAGARSSDSIIKTAATYMAFQHKDASILGTTAAYTGDFRTALGITSTGIIAGYNNKTTGAWQTTLAVEAATGNLTVLGTIKANSIIQTGAYLGSSTVSTVLSNISAAQSDASSALADLTNKLNNTGNDILSGPISFTSDGGFKTGTISIDGSGNVTGAGVAFTSKGIVGRNSSNTTFTIDATTGAATFGGRVETADYVSASGLSYVAGNQIFASNGNTYSVAGSMVGTTSATSTSGQVRCGTYGIMTGAFNANSFNIGAIGIASSSYANSFGIYGQGYVGVYGATSSVSAGIIGVNTGSGPAINCAGSFAWGGYTYTQPDGGTDKYLRNDGTWAAVGSIGGGTVTRVRGTGTVSGISLSGDVNGDGYLTLGGSLSLTSGNVTGALGFTPYNSTNPSGYVTASTSSLTNYSTTAVTVAYLGSFGNNFSAVSTFPGVSFTVSGSGTNNITYNVAQTSDRSLKKDIVPNTLGMGFIRQLEPVTYYYADNTMFGFTKKMYGLIANDVLALAGEESSLVYTNTAGPLEGKLAADYASYVAPIITALKELDARLAQLEQANVA